MSMGNILFMGSVKFQAWQEDNKHKAVHFSVPLCTEPISLIIFFKYENKFFIFYINLFKGKVQHW